MTIRPTLVRTALVAIPTAIALLAPQAAEAQSRLSLPKVAPVRTGLYVVGTLGASQGNDETASLVRATAAVGTPTDVKVESKRFTGSAGVGYRFNQYWGIEGGLVDIGRMELNATGTGDFVAKSKMRGAQFALVGYLPATEDLSFFLKFGGVWARTSYEDSVGGSDSSNTLRSYWGLGLQTHFTRNLFGRLEFLRYGNIGSSASGQNSFNHYMAGVGYLLD